MATQLTLRNAELKKPYKTEAGYFVAIVKKITNDPEQKALTNPDPKSFVSIKIRRLTDQEDMEVSPDTVVTSVTGEELQKAIDEYALSHPQIEGEDKMPRRSNTTSIKPKKELSSKSKEPRALKAPKAEKEHKESMADIITPMLEAKKHTAEEIADAVVAKFKDKKADYDKLVLQIRGPRLYNAMKALGKDKVALKPSPKPEKKDDKKK